MLPPTDSGPEHLNVDQRKGPQTTVLSSAHSIDHLQDWNRICCHSLAKGFGAAECPYYSIGMWASDFQDIVYSTSPSFAISTGITIIHTPGHTPDSLTWYDQDSHLICVGDSFYEASSADTLECQVEKSVRAPILFEERSHILTWWRSLGKVLEFVRKENVRLARDRTGPEAPPRVAISASHVTTTSPDAIPFLLRSKRL